MKKKWTFAGFIIALLISASFFFIKIPYDISETAIVQPLKEWGIYKTLDGSIITMLTDHYNEQVETYQTSEFQRGDISSFVFNKELLNKSVIKKGDTIAWVSSNDLKLQLIALKRELSYQQSLLLSYQAGNKPEELQLIKERIELAREEFETQKSLLKRASALFEQQLISAQEYDLAKNEYKVKEYTLQIEEATYKSSQTGLKAEDLNVIKAQIEGLASHINALESHIAGFNILSPISGTVLRQRVPTVNNDLDILVRIADVSSVIAYIPVDYFEEPYLEIGQRVEITSTSGIINQTGEIVSIDNSAQLINMRPKIFVTVLIDNSENGKVFSNMMVKGKIKCKPVSVSEYLKRVVNMVFEN
ncbi:MAG: hypothetical protein GX587_06690 [Bacteroidales bacterium]|nr:hypothetical protein [Bacteroidales bacterium]